jgi:hypothetical protein
MTDAELDAAASDLLAHLHPLGPHVRSEQRLLRP